MERISVFEYQEYREYLKDMIAHLKSTNSRKYSLRKVAAALDISPTLLSLILSGKRHLGKNKLSKIASYLMLTEREKSYLSNLMTFNDSPNREIRDNALQKMSTFKEFESYRRKDVVGFKYLTKWYNVAIREMANLKKFKLDKAWIQSRLAFKVYQKEIDESLKFLIDNNLITQNEEGKYIASENINCSGGIFKLSLGEFYKQLSGLLPESIDKISSSKRHLLGHTVTLNSSNYNEAVGILEDALGKIRELDNKATKNTEVYHISLHAIPLTLDKEDSSLPED